MNAPGLGALIAPNSLSDFLANNWPHTPLVVHGLDKNIAQLKQLPFLHSLEALLNSWPTLVQAHLPDLKDEASAVDANPRDARKLYGNGMGLLFNNVQNISPELAEWLVAIRHELGLPTSTHARCMIYATPDGKGTAPHFDQNVNFVLQLHGTKTWSIAPNSSVQNPTQRHTLGQPIDPELASYLHDEFPRSMPDGAQQVILKPGSLLFVPRGYWHTTAASGEALALNFTFNQPTWIDLFTLALRSRLSLSPEWRELADGVTSDDPSRRQAAEKNLEGLLLELVDDLPHWRAADILGATEGT